MMSAKTTFPWQLHGTSDLSMWKGVEFDLPPKSPGSSEYGPVWHFFAFFKKERSPLKKGHDIVCLVPWPNGQPCGREFQRPKDGSTSALFKHLKTKHPSKHNEIQQLSMRSATAKLKQNADIAQALKMGGTQSEGAGSAEATSTDSGASSGRGSGSAEKKMLAHVPSIFGAAAKTQLQQREEKKAHRRRYAIMCCLCAEYWSFIMCQGWVFQLFIKGMGVHGLKQKRMRMKQRL
mmetsp:Transcript_31993/g.78502  ORF Transcript_31993/g.78502 Transcript_31993/m.78502 type:complete len:234 (+) Transcript_31993:587-1288(+)